MPLRWHIDRFLDMQPGLFEVFGADRKYLRDRLAERSCSTKGGSAKSGLYPTAPIVVTAEPIRRISS